MTDTTPEPQPLTIEMRKGDQFVSAQIEDDADLRDSSYSLNLINSLSTGMAALGAIWPPLTEDRLRELALDYARRLISGQPMSPDQAVREYGVSYEEGAQIAELAMTATVALP